MAEPYIGLLTPVAFDFAPKGTAMCNGALLNIRQYTALYAVIGKVFGGDGVNTFALPDLRCRAAIGAVSLSSTIPQGLTPRQMGAAVGTETVALTLNQIPIHTHRASAVPNADQIMPQNNYWGGDPNGAFPVYGVPGTPNTTVVALSPKAINSAGGNAAGVVPHANMPPFTVLNYVIATVGLFPARG